MPCEGAYYKLLKCDHCGKTRHLIRKCYQLVGYPTDFKFKGKTSAQANFADASTTLKQKETLTISKDQYNDYIKWRQMKDQASIPEASANMTSKYLENSVSQVS